LRHHRRRHVLRPRPGTRWPLHGPPETRPRPHRPHRRRPSQNRRALPPRRRNGPPQNGPRHVPHRHDGKEMKEPPTLKKYLQFAALLAATCTLTALAAQPAAPANYKLTNTWDVGGEGGWDPWSAAAITLDD